ncbi:hypothetical protein COB55_03245 [Candidatus Wolfebacteria bacterium]|nr:MAG: hypothetical protein COB55_03245 [Candidatus Wolfebacteria bacterium]
MAVVQLADIYEPNTFARLAQEAQVRKNRFIQSGIAVPSSLLQTMIAPGGQTGTTTNFNPLGTPEPNYSDDSASTSTPNKIDSAEQDFRLAVMNQSWSVMDIAEDLQLGGQAAIDAITNRIGFYWATVIESRVISTLLGLLNDNVANDSSDFTLDVSNDLASPILAGERISNTNVVNTLQLKGDSKDNIVAIGMHSQLHARLQIDNLITETIDPSNKNITFQTYLGKRLIVDDSFPREVLTNRVKYTCVLFGSNVIGLASGNVLTPSESDRTPAAGLGGGQNTIWSRRNDLIHPWGFSYLDASRAGQSTTYTELEDATNWNRIYNNKNVNVSFLIVNE